MRKRLISLIAATALAVSSLTLTAFAKTDTEAEKPKLPFELSAPTNVKLTFLEGRDSYNTCEIAYSQNNSMSKWASRKADPDVHDTVVKELNAMGYDDVWVSAQIDWSIDSQNDWKCNEYWLNDGTDINGVQHLGDWAYTDFNCAAETTTTAWIFRNMGNANDPEDRTWHGNHADGDDYNGWKDVLKKDQYTLITNEDGEKYAKIDFTKHTIYTRVRWRVTLRPLMGEDKYVVSDWSGIAAVGKDAKNVEPIKKSELDAPKISNLHYTDKEFNGYPVIAFSLEVNDKLKEQLTKASGTQGNIWLEVEARVKGTEKWIGLQGDWEIKAGDMEIALQNLVENSGSIKKGTPIELRARYWCSQANVEQDFYTDWATLTFSSEASSRLAGKGRYETAVEISKATFTKASTVILAYGLNYADALAGVPLATAMDAPILLTNKDSLPDETLAEIKRLSANKVLILGGTGAISDKVENELKSNKLTTERIAGKTRFGTATAIAEKLTKNPTEICFVYGLNYADALSVSPVAALKKAPIIYLTKDGSLNADTEKYLKTVKGSVKNAYVIGGEGVISNDMASKAAKALGLEKAERVAGGNRFLTCVEVNNKFKDVLTGTSICVATGMDFPDALAGGVFAAKNKAPLFLINGKAAKPVLLDEQKSYLKNKKIQGVTTFGGTGAVPEDHIKNIETFCI